MFIVDLLFELLARAFNATLRRMGLAEARIEGIGRGLLWALAAIVIAAVIGVVVVEGSFN